MLIHMCSSLLLLHSSRSLPVTLRSVAARARDADTVVYLSFGPIREKHMHTLKGLACRKRVAYATPAPHTACRWHSGYERLVAVCATCFLLRLLTGCFLPALCLLLSLLSFNCVGDWCVQNLPATTRAASAGTPRGGPAPVDCCAAC